MTSAREEHQRDEAIGAFNEWKKNAATDLLSQRAVFIDAYVRGLNSESKPPSDLMKRLQEFEGPTDRRLTQGQVRDLLFKVFNEVCVRVGYPTSIDFGPPSFHLETERWKTFVAILKELGITYSLL